MDLLSIYNLDRDILGRHVREAWVKWASTQPNPRPSWLVPYDQLSEEDKEADRQIGEHVARVAHPLLTAHAKECTVSASNLLQQVLDLESQLKGKVCKVQVSAENSLPCPSGYIAGSVTAGKASVLLNLIFCLTVAKNAETELQQQTKVFRDCVAETLARELLHVAKELTGKMFTDADIHKALNAVQGIEVTE